MKDAWCEDPPVSALFGFDWQTADKELYTLEVHGPLIDSAAQKFATELGKRQDWSDGSLRQP
jgi:hypothetical protein